MNNGVANRNKQIKRFYDYEGKLATTPIIEFLAEHGRSISGVLLDVGCGNKPYVSLFPSVRSYVGLDMSSACADVHADGACLPIRSGSIDTVVCNQVIEHVCEPVALLAEISRVLTKDGILLLSAPQMSRLHGEPHDYYRFTKWGLKYLLEKAGLEIVVLTTHGGFFRAFGSHINFFLIERLGRRRWLLKPLRLGLTAPLNICASTLDKLIYWEKDTLGYNVLARKAVRE